jgi:hypothetical protein
MDLPEYHQISEFSFAHYRQNDCCIDTGLMDLNLCTADVTRRIYGYWSTTGGCAFAGNCDVQVSNLGQVQEVVMEGINILELKVRRSEFGGKAQEAMRLLAVETIRYHLHSVRTFSSYCAVCKHVAARADVDFGVDIALSSWKGRNRICFRFVRSLETLRERGAVFCLQRLIGRVLTCR